MKNLTIICAGSLFALCAFGFSTFAQTGETRTVPLVVMSSTGQFVTGLTPENIRVRGVKATVHSVTLDTGPRHVILLLDASGSMAEGDHPQKWLAAKNLAKALLSILPTQDFVALDVFADKDTQLVPLTHDFASVSRSIDALPGPRGKTRAGDALSSALQEIGSKAGFGDSVIFFSDGEFDDQPLRSLMLDLERRSIRVFLELTPVADAEGIPEEDYFGHLLATADSIASTGGYSFAPRISTPISSLRVLGVRSPEYRGEVLRDSVQGTYRVQLQLEEPIRKRQRFTLEVTDQKVKVPHNFFLFYPLDLYPN